jgi:hypothetical protein
MLLETEAYVSHVPVIETHDDRLGLASRAWEHVSDFQKLLRSGDTRKKVFRHSSPKDREESHAVYLVPHFDVITLLLLVERDVQHARAPPPMVLLKTVESVFMVVKSVVHVLKLFLLHPHLLPQLLVFLLHIVQEYLQAANIAFD